MVIRPTIFKWRQTEPGIILCAVRFLDGERSYRSTELSYRQVLVTYMTALEQLRQAVGTRELQ